jgi:hypothetical protein
MGLLLAKVILVAVKVGMCVLGWSLLARAGVVPTGTAWVGGAGVWLVASAFRGSTSCKQQS